MSEHTWYPENPLEGDPESAEVLAILASLHDRDYTRTTKILRDNWSGNPETDKAWKNGGDS